MGPCLFVPVYLGYNPPSTTNRIMFSVLETAKAAAAPAPAQPAAAAKGSDDGMGALGGMMSGKGGFTGGTKKYKQMNSLMNFFTTTMNSMFGSMAPKKKK